VNITIPGYKIERLIAEGGTASIYLAVQESLGRYVAIKLLRKIDNPTQLSRFLNEGRIIALLNHRNVINIHDIGVTEDGRPYISMEYLEGGDLDARIRNKVDPEDALQWLEAIGNCLDFVHRKGIIHRDIKPGNILFHKDGTLILSDFGTAKEEESDARLTLEGLAFGSPYYISPEQAASKVLDGRTDIYSLGVVLYEMLTGNKPYKGDSHIETIVAHLSEPLPDLPLELYRYHTLIRKMIAKSPDDRFSSAAEMLRFVQQLRTPAKHARLLTWAPTGAAAITAKTVRLAQQLRIAVKSARRMNWVPTGAAAIAAETVRFVQRLRMPVKHARRMAWIPTGAAAIAAETARFVQKLRIPVKHARRMTWTPTGAVAIILGIGGTVLIWQSITSDRTEHRPPPGMTISEGAVTENFPDTPETPAQEPEHLVTETAAAPDHNEHQPPPGITASGETLTDLSPVVVEMPSAEPSDLASETPVPTSSNKQRIEKLLSQASTALKEYRLTTPKNNNAYDYYQRILELHPRHKKALEGINRIADAYADLAERKLARFDYGGAREYVQRGLAIQPENTRLLGLQKSATIGKLLAQAATALKEYRLTKPKNNNAYNYYQQVLELHPRHEKALEGITRIANAYADLAERKLDRFEYAAAKEYVQSGLTIQPENTRLLALQNDTNAFRDAPKRVWKKLLSSFSKDE